jgi:glycosyltransferase involved in cell wall biosynthesis
MVANKKIAVVIPAYRVRNFLRNVITSLPDFIDFIIVIDDKCPNASYEVVEDFENIIVIHHENNQGVGGAVISGYKEALELQADIVVKVDGDGQMDNNKIAQLIEPIVNDKADYTKGNRFRDLHALKTMPKIRLFGNSILSFLIKMASGYWSIMDPTNGFTAINKKSLEDIEFDRLSKRYFFESDMLINLNIYNQIVQDVSMPARYGDEESSLNIKKVLYQFPPKIVKGLAKRIFLKYYIFDFNMGSIYMLVGLPMMIFGIVFGIIKWIEAVNMNINTSTGTIMLSALSIILGVQFLLQAINIDIMNEPKSKK